MLNENQRRQKKKAEQRAGGGGQQMQLIENTVNNLLFRVGYCGSSLIETISNELKLKGITVQNETQENM